MIFIFLRKCTYLLFFPSITLLSYLLFNRDLLLTFDSYNFLCGANTFKSTLKLFMCDFTPMVLSPPGYSIFLSAFILESPCFSCLVYCWYSIIKQEITDDFVFVFASLQMAAALPLFYVHLFVWSEGLFVFLISTGLFSYYRFKVQNNVYWLILFATAFGLSVTVKYIGLLIFVSIVLGSLLSNKNAFRKYQYFILCIPLLSFIGVILNNYNSSGSFTGIRPFLNRDGFEILQSCSGVIFNWVAPANLIPSIFWVLFILGFSLVTLYFSKASFIWASTFIGFFLFLFISAWRTDIEYDERLFVPIFPFFVMLIFNLLQNIPNFKSVFYFRNAFLIYWTVYSFLRLGKNVIEWAY